MCNECFDGHVQDQATQEVGRINARHGEITCPYATPQLKCLSKPYTHEVVARHTSSATLRAFLHALTQLQERRLAQEMETQKKEAIHLELARLAKLSALERQVDAARKHVEDDVLTLMCPHAGCRQAFVDFSDCFALTCSRCRGYFCAWCLDTCESWQQSHRHVAGCALNRSPNRSVFGSPALFELAQKDRRIAALEAYVASLDAEVRTTLLQALRGTLSMLGLE